MSSQPRTPGSFRKRLNDIRQANANRTNPRFHFTLVNLLWLIALLALLLGLANLFLNEIP